ncbi:hypothetical protein QUF61_01630 [Candidatus Venteria ishoeyi]|uniref:hypothetical protein n=1 Tax=Candidatus Venteria ishoeyi TaxID=1899563 RepID=UPI0025A4E9CA|nr:hypothetical protein [Candidatus Venteria ishoeyi]MDM8545173.1 hypothetical protein [Candidatus Venteria ishoeyi]
MNSSIKTRLKALEGEQGQFLDIWLKLEGIVISISYFDGADFGKEAARQRVSKLRTQEEFSEFMRDTLKLDTISADHKTTALAVLANKLPG